MRDNFFRRARTSQPQAATGINWGNADALGLISFVDTSAGKVRDLVGGTEAGPVALTAAASLNGLYQAYDGSSSRYSYNKIVFNSLAKGTAIVRFRMDSFGTQIIWYEAGLGSNQFALNAPTSSGGTMVLNMGSNTARTFAKSSWALGQVYTIAICWDADISVYIDSALDSTFTGVGGCNSSSTVGAFTSLGAYDIGASLYGQFFNGLIGPAEVYSRKLDAGAVARRTLNPNGLLSPQSRSIWAPAAAGGGNTAALPGQTATSTAGTTTPSLSLAISGNSGTASQGTVTAALSLALTGNTATSTQGTVTPSLSLALSGNTATATAGTPTSSVPGGVGLTGNGTTSASGTPVAALSLALTGSGATTSAGTVTSSLSQTAALTGQAATATAGTPIVSLSLGLTGNTATATPGTISASSAGGTITVALTGNAATASVGLVGAPDSGQFSGGYEHLSRRQTPKQRKEERQRLGIIAQDIREATQKVARAVIADTGRTDPASHFNDHKAQFMQMLVNELKGYQPPEIADAITRQIRIAYAIQEQEEEEILLLMH